MLIADEIPFTSVLAKSLTPEKVTPAWCEICQKYAPTLQSRQLTKLPQILALNCGLDTQKVNTCPLKVKQKIKHSRVNLFILVFHDSFQDKDFWQKQMDIVVHKVVKGKEDTSPASSPTLSVVKPCRYGTSCSRVGCRFRHAGRASGKIIV